MWVVLAGLGSGAVHAVAGPDHLLALAPLSAGGRSRAWRMGLRWGLGHGLGTLIVVLLSWWLFGIAEGVSAWGERLGGLTLIVAGLLLFRDLVNARRRAHRGEAPSSWEGRAALGVGLIHGLAGGISVAALLSGLRASLPGLEASPVSAGLYLGGFAVGSTAAMVLLTALLATALRERKGGAGGESGGFRRWQEGAAALLGMASLALGVTWLVAPGSSL